MKDNHFTLLALLAIAGSIGWYFYETQDSTANSTGPGDSGNPLPVAWDTPMGDVYAANPAAYQPATPASLTLNIPNQALSLLSDQYMPLFGFTGIAQGEMYN